MPTSDPRTSERTTSVNQLLCEFNKTTNDGLGLACVCVCLNAGPLDEDIVAAPVDGVGPRHDREQEAGDALVWVLVDVLRVVNVERQDLLRREVGVVEERAVPGSPLVLRGASVDAGWAKQATILLPDDSERHGGALRAAVDNYSVAGA